MLESEAQRIARAGGKPYVIPEGGSNGLGSLGYVSAMREVRGQMDLGLADSRAPFDEIVHACGSGGTAAGVVLGAARYDVAKRVRAVAVCDDAAYFERVIDRIVTEARGYDAELDARAPLVVDESARGPAYGVMSASSSSFLAPASRARAGPSSTPSTPARRCTRCSTAVVRAARSRRGRASSSFTPGGCRGCSRRGRARGESCDRGAGGAARRPIAAGGAVVTAAVAIAARLLANVLATARCRRHRGVGTTPSA